MTTTFVTGIIALVFGLIASVLAVSETKQEAGMKLVPPTIALFVGGWPMNTTWQLSLLWSLGALLATIALLVTLLTAKGGFNTLRALVITLAIYLGFYLTGGFDWTLTQLFG